MGQRIEVCGGYLRTDAGKVTCVVTGLYIYYVIQVLLVKQNGLCFSLDHLYFRLFLALICDFFD
jgi:hypothetical protein